MPSRWVLVVNRIEARVYDAQSMRLLHKLSNQLGREKNRAFTRGKPGIGRNRMASRASTHNMTGEKNPHADAAIQFCKKIGLFLQRRLNEKRFDSLLITAEPRMQGWLKSNLSKAILDRAEWNSKDLNKFSDHELKILFLGKGAVWPVAPSFSS